MEQIQEKPEFTEKEFSTEDFTPPDQSRRANEDNIQKLFLLRENDIRWRLKNRKIYGGLLLLLLFFQNFVVFGLVIQAFQQNTLSDLQLILGILTTATLVETIASVNIIVKWLFNDIDYTKK